MAENGIGDYFISDIDDDFDDEELLTPPVVVPVRTSEPTEPAQDQSTPAQVPAQAEPEATIAAAPVRPDPAPEIERPEPTPVEPERPKAVGTTDSREQQLADALDAVMQSNHDIQAAALVSLDGFTMASALPEGMQEDRVGAMSAAILGLGERAAAELGRGTLSQVYIEGDDGIVVLMSAGGRAVLTALASAEARLGLVLFDMRAAADEIGSVLA